MGAISIQRVVIPVSKKSKVTLRRNTHNVIDKIDSVATQRMYAAAQEVRNETLKTLSGNRTGRTYRVPGTKTYYIASAPGEPPAVLTGQLRQSVKTNVYSKAKAVKGEVGTGLHKGLMLEKGTKKMAPRPWLEPSFDKSLERVKSILSRRWF